MDSVGLSSLSPSKRSSQSIVLVIGLSWGSRGGVQAPSGLQGLRDLPRLTELEVTDFLGNDGALVFGRQLGHKFGLKIIQ